MKVEVAELSIVGFGFRIGNTSEYGLIINLYFLWWVLQISLFEKARKDNKEVKK